MPSAATTMRPLTAMGEVHLRTAPHSPAASRNTGAPFAPSSGDQLIAAVHVPDQRVRRAVGRGRDEAGRGGRALGIAFVAPLRHQAVRRAPRRPTASSAGSARCAKRHDRGPVPGAARARRSTLRPRQSRRTSSSPRRRRSARARTFIPCIVTSKLTSGPFPRSALSRMKPLPSLEAITSAGPVLPGKLTRIGLTAPRSKSRWSFVFQSDGKKTVLRARSTCRACPCRARAPPLRCPCDRRWSPRAGFRSPRTRRRPPTPCPRGPRLLRPAGRDCHPPTVGGLVVGVDRDDPSLDVHDAIARVAPVRHVNDCRPPSRARRADCAAFGSNPSAAETSIGYPALMRRPPGLTAQTECDVMPFASPTRAGHVQRAGPGVDHRRRDDAERVAPVAAGDARLRRGRAEVHRSRPWRRCLVDRVDVVAARDHDEDAPLPRAILEVEGRPEHRARVRRGEARIERHPRRGGLRQRRLQEVARRGSGDCCVRAPSRVGTPTAPRRRFPSSRLRPPVAAVAARAAGPAVPAPPVPAVLRLPPRGARRRSRRLRYHGRRSPCQPPPSEAARRIRTCSVDETSVGTQCAASALPVGALIRRDHLEFSRRLISRLPD